MTVSPIATSASPLQLPTHIQEIAITVTAQDLGPNLLNENFLKAGGIVPEDWELARPPVAGPGGSQVVFKNGLSIVAQPRTLSFMETIGDRPLDSVQAGVIAQQYIKLLPKADYQGLTISPKCLVPFPQNTDGARQFITRTLLAPGPWQDFGKTPVQAGVNFLYQLETCQLNVNINQATIQIPEQPNVSALLFVGNFNYPINAPDAAMRVSLLEQYLKGWQSDFQTFRSMVDEQFLGQRQPATVFG